MIYPQAGQGASGSSRKTPAKPTSTDRSTRGVIKKYGRGNKQVVQWKQRNVKEGVVIVDEQQLSKLIKREPIEKLYNLDDEPFATGLFASVRRCVSKATGQVYAAKFSSRARYGDDCSAEIHHEIALLSLCAPSPRIVKLYDVFETAKEIIIVMEFAPGGDLQTIIDDNLVPFEADVVNFVRQLVEGLAYLHERKIAHLDIKPQNLVMMGDFPNCDVKLCDFEISRVILEGTEIREILGTPDYVAPEILHYEPITMAADLWSLGVTTYVLLTGFSPFGGETDQETFCNISRAQLDFPEELFEDVSQDARDFIAKLLARDPSARPSAKDLLKHRWLANRTAKDTATKPNIGNRNANMSQQNLRKYLSKSREALFERVVQQQARNNDLRKTTLLQQYNKTRLCESHMSLVSKSRDVEHHPSLSPSFSRSKEKLYGLRSLSKSHEGLDLLKLSGRGEKAYLRATSGDLSTVKGDDSKGYVRATTADLSMLPLLRLQEMSSESSSETIDGEVVKVSSGVGDGVEKVDADIQVEVKKPDDAVEVKNNVEDKPVSVEIETVDSKINEKVEEILVEHKLNEEVTKEVVEMKVGDVLEQKSDVLEEKGVVEDKVKKIEKIKASPVASLVSPRLLLRSGLRVEPSEIDAERNESEKVNPNKVTIDKEIKSENSVVELTSPQIVNQINDLKTVHESSSKSNMPKESPSQTETPEESGEQKSDEDEPKFSVAQLVSAYNRHQEIVTKSSLEVTMTANDKDTKIPPVIAEDPTKKFPTGPKALRLFIPDIQIEPVKRPKKNRTKSFRSLQKAATEAQESVEAKSENVDTTNVNFLIDNNATKTKTCVNYLRSGSLSSENSGSCFTSGSSGSLSWEEIIKDGSLEKVEMIPGGKDVWKGDDVKKTEEVVGGGVNPWGRLCNGSYTRAMEKFGKVEEKEKPTRKISLTTMCVPKEDEKVRRKSTSTMKNC